MNVRYMPQKAARGKPLYRLWLDDENKVVSFHEVPQGTVVDFYDADRFRDYIDILVMDRWKFQ